MLDLDRKLAASGGDRAGQPERYSPAMATTGLHLPHGRAEAEALDAADPATALADEFVFPRHPRRDPDGSRAVYLCGNSLGLMPRAAKSAVARVLQTWEEYAVEGHFAGDEPWYRYDEPIAALHTGLVGAGPTEIAVANGLTANLHFLMASFYRPRGSRRKILIEPHAFPSDRYAVQSQVAWHGGDPETDVVEIECAQPDHVTASDVAATLERHGDAVALALVGGINYYTGQVLPMDEMCALLREADITIGLDLAHLVGNVPIDLPALGDGLRGLVHVQVPQLRPWCRSRASMFVRTTRPMRAWSASPVGGETIPPPASTCMAKPQFVPRAAADSWKVSNPSILATAPGGCVVAALRPGGSGRAARAISASDRLLGRPAVSGTGRNHHHAVGSRPSAVASCRCASRPMPPPPNTPCPNAGVIVDARDPDVIRLAPTPLYNSFADCWDAAATLGDVLGVR